MKKIIFLALVLSALVLSSVAATNTIQHPCLMLTPSEVAKIKSGLGHAPLFDAAFSEAKTQVEKALAAPLDVPVPLDASGVTSQRHEKNGSEMQLAGFLFQITGEKRYASFVKDLLDRYAVLYPTLGKHPASKGITPGRLFWQPLNECVWLSRVSQAYDGIYDSLTSEERARYEKNIFRPMVKFITEDCKREFDKIHNHGTWAVTPVGMIGYVMGDETIVRQALYGSKMDGSAGYLRQLDELFSPDGYYCEGPYYSRYALIPFYLFATVIQNNQPELKIFERRDALLRKALYALIQQTYNGAYFPINDAMKEMSFYNLGTVFALDHAYSQYGQDPQLLAVARLQDHVSLDAAGLAVAQALAATPQPPAFPFASTEFTDGPQGSGGGLGILRSGAGTNDSVAVMKYTSFGMDHGHYDKLALLYYDQGREILPDYGSARFVNIEQKFGGRYLNENDTFARQTIAHNTITVDERSDYRGKFATANTNHSDRQFFDSHDPDFQIMSATDTTAVPGVAMQRTIALIRDARLEHPVVVDVFRLNSEKPHRYDYPFYFLGHFMDVNVELTNYVSKRHPLGEKDGYQHLWLEAEGQAAGPVAFTWLCGGLYYTITTAADDSTRVLFTRIGANDPEFNLRNEPAFMLRQNAKSHVFASAIEPHGRWDGMRESTSGGESNLRSVTVLASTDEGTVVRVTGKKKLEWTFMISSGAYDPAKKHSVKAGDETFTWDGNASLIKK